MATIIKLKSASCQLAYWEAGSLRIVNYLTRRTFSANPIALEVIRFFFTPRTMEEAFVEFRSYSSKSVAETILKLIEAQLLLEYGSFEWRRDASIESSWEPWLPGGAFHFLTKDTPYIAGDATLEERLQTLSKAPIPPQFKTIDKADRIWLPRQEIDKDAFFQTLHARRTHRAFAKGNVPLGSAAKLLQTVWGVQGYFESPTFGKLPYKTSPYGGARQPIEVYLIARKIDGLKPGLYHCPPK